MIDWLTIVLALVIIIALIATFGLMAWRINMPDPVLSTNVTGKKDDATQRVEPGSGKKKKDKNSNEQTNKRRKDARKHKKEDDQRRSVKFEEPIAHTSEESDNEQEESEHEISTPLVPEPTTKVSERNTHKTRHANASAPIEGILSNKNEKSPITTHPQQIPHPISSTNIPKDEVELAKQHNKGRGKATQQSHKQTTTTVSTTKNPTQQSTNVNQGVQKPQQQQQQQQHQPEQPFTTVGGNRHKGGQSASQQQQQKSKSANTTTSTSSAAAPSTQQQQAPVQVQHEQLAQRQPPRQQQAPVQVQHEQLAQRQQPRQQQAPVQVQHDQSAQRQQPRQQQAPVQVQHDQSAQRQQPRQQQTSVQAQYEQIDQRQPANQQKETSTQLNGFNANALPVKQQTVAAPTATTTASVPSVKVADIVKALPTSQAVVTELMSAFDAVLLSPEELEIMMHKIANKQSVVKQDWTKLQHGQKVDPQAHIGQILDESARAHEEDMRQNAMKRLQELTEERNNDKRRINELLKEISDKEMNMQVLRAQFNSIQHPQQQQLQTFQAEFKRIADENTELKRRLAQQPQHFQQQQQQHPSLNLIGNNDDSSNIQLRVLSEQVKKLSVDNGNYEKQINSKDLLIKEVQKEKDDLIRSNQQLTQKLQESQKQFQHNEEKLVKEINENRNFTMTQINEYKRRIEQLELDNEKLKHEEIIHVEPTVTTPPTLNNEERENFEKEINQLKQQLHDESEQNTKKFKELQTQHQSQENELRQELEQLKKLSEQSQNDQTHTNQLAEKNAQIDALRAELDEAKATNDSINSQLNQHIQQERTKQKQYLTELLEQDLRKQLPNDNQDFDQWLSTYRQIFTSNIESRKRTLEEESAALKRENDLLHRNMNDAKNQLKEIEQTVQSKEEMLLSDLQNKEAIVENMRGENDQLNNENQRLRNEINRLQRAHDSAINEVHALKLQLDERFLVTANSPSTTNDESFEFIKQPSPPPKEIDARVDVLNELIRSSKQALENQDSIVQQLNKHLNEIQIGGTGEISNSNVNESTTSSTNQEQQFES